MSLTKTPTSSLSVIELLAKRVWYRSLAKIQKMRSGGPSPETSTTRSSPATRLPQEIVEMIIVYLIYDKHSLCACTLTCYSWYIAAVSHLHHTLVIDTGRPWDLKFRRPNAVQHMHMLGLLPLVKKLCIYASNVYDYDMAAFTPKTFHCCTLHKFSAITNVQELGIEFLDIPEFMPGFQRHFGHFLPTVRSLTLRLPKGSHRQIIYFIGLFRHLEDLELVFGPLGPNLTEEAPVRDLTLIPPFAPPLRGRLAMTFSRRVELVEDMIRLFGGIRFRSVDLLYVGGARLLLNACVETLETLRLHQTDPRGSPLRDFDLSRHKSLRTLEILASTIVSKGLGLLTHVLPIITSPTFSKVIVIYRDYDFGVLSVYPRVSPDEVETEASHRRRQLEALREIRKVRDFQVVLYADVRDHVRGYVERVLKDAVAVEKAKKGADNFFSELSVISSPREFHPLSFWEVIYAGSSVPRTSM